jgi:hypothetical protein
MISDPKIAREIIERMVDLGDRAQETMKTVEEKCSPEDFKTYKKAIGRVVGAIVFDVIAPIYDVHPELKPPGWDK